MGQGIAKAFAQVEGYEVALCDIKQEWAEGGKEKIKKGYARLVEKGKMTQEAVDGILAKITPGLKEDLSKDCELIVEAAFENMEVKKTTFKELDEIAKPDCIFASNTSSLSITEIGNGLTRPMIGMHFFNPADRMKQIEVIAGVNTPDETVSAIKKISEEIGKTPVQVNEAAGFVVNRILIPMIIPVDCPLWILAIAVAFSVIFVKEVFGGTGMNIFNVALAARVFMFFGYPTKMSGDAVWVSGDSILGIGQHIDCLTVSTPLGATATTGTVPDFSMDMIYGLIPGSVGETSVIAIALGAILLIWTGIASWKILSSVFVGGAIMAFVFNTIGPDTSMAQMPWYEHLVLGGFCFGAVFMATDPVTAARTETGKYIYGFLIGVMAIIIRVLNPGYPEGMMLAILFMNIFAPLIDYFVVQQNIKHRERRTICSK